jgi:hypothetical protein
MASNVNDITITYEEDGVQIIKQTDKQILSKGSWATIIFKYQQWDNNKQAYGPDRYTIRRYRKVNDEYRQQAKFNISSADQARKIIAALETWLKEISTESQPAAEGTPEE